MSEMCSRTNSTREDIISSGDSNTDLAGLEVASGLFCFSSQACTLGSASRFNSAWISDGGAVSAAGFAGFGVNDGIPAA